MNVQTAEQDGPHLGDYLATLWRRKWLILGPFLAGLLAGEGRNLSTIPIYEATATLQIGPPAFASMFDERQSAFLGSALRSFDSEIAVLRSRTLAEETVKQLQAGGPLDEGRFRAAVDDLRPRTSVQFVKGNILAVKVTSPVPEAAAREANALSEVYIAYTVRRRTTGLSLAEEFIGRQLDLAGQKLRTTQEALTAYQAKHRTPTVASATVLKKLIELDSERAKVEARQKEAEALLDLLRQPKSVASQGLLFFASGVPVADKLAGQLVDLEVHRAMLRTGVTERHPEIVSLNARINEVKGWLARETEATVKTLKDRERHLAGALGQYEVEIKRLSGEDLDALDLFRSSKVSEELYGFFLKKQEEARMAVASEVGDARMLDRALPSQEPILPKTRRNLLLGGIVGLAFGIGLAFVRERMDRSVRSVDDLEKLLGLPVFGTIPAIAPKGKRTRQSVSPLLVRIEQRSAALEAFRTLRTNIQFALPEVQAKCFLLTSPGPGEGKSLTCANLAIALAQMGGRIILMDADLRKPVLHRHFRVPQEAGLSNLLAGQIEWRSAVRPTRVENLDVLPAGLIPPNPPEILGSNRMKLLVQELVRHYDVILLDSPPVLLFTDASVLGSMVDGVFLVAKAGVTTPEAILRTKGLLQAGSARVLGSILIAARREHSYHSHGYSRYYGGEDGWLMRLKHEIRRWNSRR